MADAAVQYLMENLKQLLLYNAELIFKVKDEVEALFNELSMLKAFLEDCTAKRSEYKVVKELVSKIRAVTYEAEDAIDTFVVEAAVQKARNKIQKMFHIFDHPAKLRSVATEVKTIRAKVKEIYDNKLYGFEALQRGDSGGRTAAMEKKAPVVEEDNVVGFEDEANMLIGRLIGAAEDLQVISLVGMAGLGKTTLAKKVYTDPRITYVFSTRAWIYVSQVYNRKELFLGILSSVTQVTSDMYSMNDERLAEEVRRHLTWKFLIVMDDVWTKEGWNDLKMVFPNLKNGSRILLTSRNRNVAVQANPDPESPPHDLRFLTHAESWELLQKKVFGRGSCPSELVDIGRQIATKCDGLPLAIVVIAGLLPDKPKHWWETVAESVKSYIVRDSEKCLDVLALSYNHLPHHLKACFLYFGVFPEDYEIPAWKLIRLWIAEGFIQQTGEVCLEDIAEEHLEDLVGRNLVLVAKRSSNGRIKTCRIHDMLRDLCLREAKEENFFWEIKEFGQIPAPSSSSPTANNFYRRLCIHSRILEYISSKPAGMRVRSFLCFASEKMNLPHEHVSFIPEFFKLLRVLDTRPLSFHSFPSDIKQLVHLRYIAIFGNFKVLPASVSNLWNLQTLIVDTTSRTIDIQADIWKMLQLRHVRTSGTSRLRGPAAKERKDHENPFVRKNLQTLSTISPDSCTENVLARTPNIKKLGIRGKLAHLMEEKSGYLFDNLTKLHQLVTLKLLNDIFPYPPSEGKLPGLPQLYKFPPKLKKLTLLDTFLDWEHMSVLGMLEKLEVLKLKDNAFTGIEWKPLEKGFRQLKVLQIGKTNLVYWEASADHFPKLQRLVLRSCTSLQAIPSGLGDIPTLQMMELYWPLASAAASARKIQQQQGKQQQSMVNNAFKVTIYPPDH